jgi:hypothetical protein
MNNYNCERCGYSTDRKGNFSNHLFRKRICKPTKADINIELLRIKHGLKIVNGKSIESKCFLEKSKCFLEKSKCFSNKKYVCDYCEKNFKSKQGKYQHQKKYCKIKKQQEENSFKNILLQKENDIENLKKENKEIKIEMKKEKEEIKIEMENKIKEIKDEMRKQIEVLLEKVGNNITVNNTTNNNIQLNNYGNEDMGHITNDIIKKLIETPYNSVSGLITTIHFDDKCPENKNVRITNRKLPYAEVYTDDRWKLCNKAEVVNEMVNKKSTILDNKFEEIKETLPTDTNTKYDTFKHNREWDIFSRKKILKNAEIAILDGNKT